MALPASLVGGDRARSPRIVASLVAYLPLLSWRPFPEGGCARASGDQLGPKANLSRMTSPRDWSTARPLLFYNTSNNNRIGDLTLLSTISRSCTTPTHRLPDRVITLPRSTKRLVMLLADGLALPRCSSSPSGWSARDPRELARVDMADPAGRRSYRSWAFPVSTARSSASWGSS